MDSRDRDARDGRWYDRFDEESMDNTKYLGPDNIMRSRDAYLSYLEQCARLWDAWSWSTSAERLRCAEQAARVRAYAARIGGAS